MFLAISPTIFRFRLGICCNLLIDLFSLQLLLGIYYTYSKNLEETAFRYPAFDLRTNFGISTKLHLECYLYFKTLV